jgi:hypothetical protein
MVSSELLKMSEEKQEVFLEEYNRRKKSTLIAYILWLCLGLHYIYFGKWGTQFIFWFTGGGLIIWYCIDLLRIPGIVSDHNKTIAIEVMMNLKTISRNDHENI